MTSFRTPNRTCRGILAILVGLSFLLQQLHVPLHLTLHEHTAGGDHASLEDDPHAHDHHHHEHARPGGGDDAPHKPHSTHDHVGPQVVARHVSALTKGFLALPQVAFGLPGPDSPDAGLAFHATPIPPPSPPPGACAPRAPPTVV
jgi:hypothetical protein